MQQKYQILPTKYEGFFFDFIRRTKYIHCNANKTIRESNKSINNIILNSMQILFLKLKSYLLIHFKSYPYEKFLLH